MSVAQTVYLLATVLERADNDLLWLAILGLTYQYVSSRINRDRYEAYHGLFLDEVVRLNHEQIHRKMPNPDDRSIAKSEELRFTLFRHWNLYDAMLHSGYVAGRMGIWKEKGKKRLQGLLAKMGYVFCLLSVFDTDWQILASTMSTGVLSHGHGSEKDVTGEARSYCTGIRSHRTRLPLIH